MQGCFLSVLIAILLLCSGSSFAHGSVNAPIEFKFCYENKEFYPHFLGNSTLIPKDKPGALIEVLQRLDELVPAVAISYTRKPWARCLNLLESGSVSAVIGSFSQGRSEYAVYPLKDGQLDVNKAIDNLSTCLVVLRSSQFTMKEVTTVAVPYGYIVSGQLKNVGFKVYETDSLSLAHQLLISKRVSASVIDCNNSLVNEKLRILPKPIRQHQGYLMMSKKFYRRSPEIAMELWNTLSSLNRKDIYSKYQ